MKRQHFFLHFFRKLLFQRGPGRRRLYEYHSGGNTLKYLVANATLFGYLFFNSHIGTVLWLMWNRFTYNISLGVLLGVLSAGCGLLAWVHWSSIDEFVIGFKSVEELYPSSPLGVDSADTSQLPKEKNLRGKFQYFQIAQPGSSTVTPLYQ